jgi:hypothetical protein
MANGSMRRTGNVLRDEITQVSVDGRIVMAASNSAAVGS